MRPAKCREMRFSCLAVLATVAGVSLLGCSSAPADSASEADGNLTEHSPDAACSLTYWKWVEDTLEPAFARPIEQLSNERMMELVAKHPPQEETPQTYSVCWAPLFAKHFVGDALYRLHQANLAFVDPSSPSYRSRDRYLENAAMSPQVLRNANAVLALRPATMDRSDMSVWFSTYDTFLGEMVHPLAIPGPLAYEPETVVENEWELDASESPYLSIVERARAEPSKDGVYAEWLKGYRSWVFGPPPAVTRSYVFNLIWEPSPDSDSYGLSGIQMNGDTPFVPSLVQAFVDRLRSTMPKAIGRDDSAAWMSAYYARGLRTLGNLPQNQPMVTKTDALALDFLEHVKPPELRGLFSYQSWIDLQTLAYSRDDHSWAERFARAEPCVDEADLAVAKQSYTDKKASSEIPAPHVCSN